MPAASSHPSATTGHGAHVPNVTTGGSPNVFINGKPALRVGDATAVHIKPGNSPAPHASAISVGSSTVFINGQPAARIGDSIACGDAVAEGSSNVFIGG